MRIKIHNSLLQYVIRRRNGYLVLACGSIFLNILLSIGIISMIGHEKILLIPPKISQTFWVDSKKVSPEYLSEMSYFFGTLRLNITSSNTENQREMLLRYVSPEYYRLLKTELDLEAEQMTRDHITTVFYPVDIKVNNERLEALIIGDLITTVGVNQLPARRVIYKIVYSYNNYRLLVKKLIEVKQNV
jgi:conjugal transfer pilus assembly protein TraE